MKPQKPLQKQLFWLIKWLSKARQKSANSGFTLTEILVSMIVAGIIMSGLMTVMVELLTSDARETARNETQQEMQMAMDYIAADIREAVFVYDGNCLDGQTAACGEGALFNSLDVPNPDDTVPILAFWKLDDLPPQAMGQCNFNNLDDPNTAHIPCISGRMYTLVVYFFTRNNVDEAGGGSGPWAGMGRIRRAEHRQFDGQGNLNSNYIPLGSSNSGFESWPNGETVQMSTPLTLVDFVDDRPMDVIAQQQDVAGMDVSCPPNYNLTPSENTLSEGFGGMRNFYACVLDEVGRREEAREQERSQDDTAFNQRVILFIRGNAAGKPGIRSANEGFMPAIQTQVVNRSVPRKRPRQF